MDNETHEQFTRLLKVHEPELMRWILVAVPNRSDARDIMQECSVALWNKFEHYDADRSFVAWAIGFVRIEVSRFLRNSSRRQQLNERAATLLLQDHERDSAQLDPRKNHLQDCFDRLTEPQKNLIDGYYRMEYPVSELARRMGQTVEAIYKALQRIRRSLQRCIESKVGGANG